MSGEKTAGADLARLEQILDVYGGDEARWPASAKVELAPLLAASEAARRALAEAKALDKVLAEAPDAAGARVRGLADRIMAGVAPAAADAAARAGAEVVDLAQRRRPAVRPPSRRGMWQAAAVMAASLVLGILVGASDVLGPSLDGVAALAGLTCDSDTLTAALGQGGFTALDEDTL